MSELPAVTRPLIGVAAAARLAGMHPRTFRRWLRAQEAQFPHMVQKCRSDGKRSKWLVQVHSLGEALGRTMLDIETIVSETAARVDSLDRRVERLEEKIGRVTK